MGLCLHKCAQAHAVRLMHKPLQPAAEAVETHGIRVLHWQQGWELSYSPLPSPIQDCESPPASIHLSLHGSLLPLVCEPLHSSRSPSLSVPKRRYIPSPLAGSVAVPWDTMGRSGGMSLRDRWQKIQDMAGCKVLLSLIWKCRQLQKQEPMAAEQKI